MASWCWCPRTFLRTCWWGGYRENLPLQFPNTIAPMTERYAHHHLGHYEQAVAYYRQALDLRSELADRYGQAVSYDYLGDSYHALGNVDAARDAWKNALDVLDSLGHADVGHVHPGEIHAKLLGLNMHEPELRSSTETE